MHQKKCKRPPCCFKGIGLAEQVIADTEILTFILQIHCPPQSKSVNLNFLGNLARLQMKN